MYQQCLPLRRDSAGKRSLLTALHNFPALPPLPACPFHAPFSPHCIQVCVPMRSGALSSLILPLRQPSSQEALSIRSNERTPSQEASCIGRRTHSERFKCVSFKPRLGAGSLAAKGPTSPTQSFQPTRVLVPLLCSAHSSSSALPLRSCLLPSGLHPHAGASPSGSPWRQLPAILCISAGAQIFFHKSSLTPLLSRAALLQVPRHPHPSISHCRFSGQPPLPFSLLPISIVQAP